MSDGARIRIGTSGWSYRHWVGPFYPEGTAARDYLAYYAARFDATELNNTFYSLPKPERFREWAAETPAGFLFACKASRYITHMKKLKDPAASTAKFLDAVAALGGKCGPILFQLPPHWGCDLARLESFIAELPEGYRHAFEFRDESWFDARVYDLLQRRNAALVIHDLEGTLSPCRATADFVYLRLHGPFEAAYCGSYDDAALRRWADTLLGWREEGRDVYCFFDNDEAGYAATNALTLMQMVEG